MANECIEPFDSNTKFIECYLSVGRKKITKGNSDGHQLQ